MPEVAICTENFAIPALGAGIMFQGEWVEYPPDYFVQQLLVWLPLLIKPLFRNIVVLDRTR